MVVLALGAMVYGQQQGFRSGLLDYARKLEQSRLPELSEQLAQRYAADGNWDQFRDRPRRWIEIAHQLAARSAETPRADRSDSADPRELGPGADERPMRGPPPGRWPADGRPPPRPGRPGPPGAGGLRRVESDPAAMEFPRRLSLRGADGQHLAGASPTGPAFSQPIRVDEDTVGYLVLADLPTLRDTVDIDFQREQARLAGVIAAVILLLTALASLLLSRRLLRRVALLASASRRLSTGDYGDRLGPMGGDELGELARDFDHLADALERGRDARDRWVADVSHELRTPLTVLRGELHALQDGVRPLDARAVDSMAVEADRLQQRIEDLYALTLSDHGGMRYRFAFTDLLALVVAASDSARAAAERAGLSLTTRLPDHAALERADSERLYQLLGNLLANSVRYTDRGGRIFIVLSRCSATVDIESDRSDLHRAGDGWQLSVEDSAPGVPSEETQVLFERHHRGADGARRAPDGAGLGLAICRNIVLAHGGHVRAEASPLGGLRIVVWLPGDAEESDR